MAIYQGDIGIDDIKINETDVFEIYQGTSKVYPSNYFTTVTFNLNTSGTVSIAGYTPVINDNNTQFIFTLPVKTNYTANIQADHYNSEVIAGITNYKPIVHNVELVWKTEYNTYTVTFPTDGVKVLFDGVEQGVITDGNLVVSIDDRVAKDKYNVTFDGSKDSVYNTDGLTVTNINVPNTGGSYDLRSNDIVKDDYIRIDYESSTGEITRNSSYNGSWIETIVNLKAANSSKNTTLGTISNYVLIIPNNETASAKNGTFVVTFMTEAGGIKNVTANIAQTAGSKVYSDWTLNLTTDGTTVPAAGGIKNVTANIAQRTYKWNNIGTVYTETGTPTLSINNNVTGNVTLDGNRIIFTNNESVTSLLVTLTATYVGLTKTVTIIQQAGSKVYSDWSNWTISLSAEAQTLPARGGSTLITTSASRSRTWTWNGVGTVHTENANGVPSLSGDVLGFNLSGTLLTARNNESTNSRSINIVASYEGVTKSITISQSAGAKVYGEWSKWTINRVVNGDSTTLNFFTIPNSGGSATMSASAIRTRPYKWNDVGTKYTEQGSGVPTLVKESGDGIVTINGTFATVSYGNNTTTIPNHTLIRTKIDTTYVDSTFIHVEGVKRYSAWTPWDMSINSSNSNIAASGGKSTINAFATRSRTWTWNNVAGSGGTETQKANAVLSKISGDGTLYNNVVSYSNNTSTNARSSVIRATVDSTTKDITITQDAGAKTYSSWSSWNISITASPTTVSAAGGSSNITVSASRSRTWQWNGTGTSYTETDNKTPTLSKVSGDANLTGTTIVYSNNTSTSIKSSTIRATIDNATKDIVVSQSAGSKVYSNWSPTTFNISISSSTVGASGGTAELSGTWSRTRTYTWNGVGNAATETQQDVITSWSTDTAGTLVVSSAKAMANWSFNNTLYERTAKFYANRDNETSTNYVAYTQDKGVLIGYTYDYASVQVSYKGNILFNSYNDYQNYIRSTPEGGGRTFNITLPNAAFRTKLYYRIRINLMAYWQGGTVATPTLLEVPFYGLIDKYTIAPETGLYLVGGDVDKNTSIAERHKVTFSREEECFIIDSSNAINTTKSTTTYELAFLYKGKRYSNAIITNLFTMNISDFNEYTNVITSDFKIENNILYGKFNKNLQNGNHSISLSDGVITKILPIMTSSITANEWFNIHNVANYQSYTFYDKYINSVYNLVLYNHFGKIITNGDGYEYS